MAATGLGFAAVSDFWPLLVIAIVGTLNPSSGDVSVFLPLEHAVLSQAARDRERTAVFARYSLVGALAAGVGALAAALPAMLARRPARPSPPRCRPCLCCMRRWACWWRSLTAACPPHVPWTHPPGHARRRADRGHPMREPDAHVDEHNGHRERGLGNHV